MPNQSNILIIAGIVLAVLALVASNALFAVSERQHALVFRFGQLKVAYTEPGLKAKVPFVDEVVIYPAQVLQVGLQPLPVKLSDKKVLNVDSYAYYRIKDPFKFYLRLETIDKANRNLSDRINSSLRNILGRYTLQRVLSEERQDILNQIRKILQPEAAALGIELLEVRIHRTELPAETRDALYQRMMSERQRIAKEIRAQGEEEGQQIRARADRERTVMLAETEKEAQKLRGLGDAEATGIYAEAFNADPEFYAFYRSLEAYRKALSGKDTALVLHPDSPFFRYFNGAGAVGR
jgi:modulator of FtsH protease HflC